MHVNFDNTKLITDNENYKKLKVKNTSYQRTTNREKKNYNYDKNQQNFELEKKGQQLHQSVQERINPTEIKRYKC